MERLKALPTGSKLLLASSVALFASLFFTWQRLEVDFGAAGTTIQPLDGWDAWGLLVGLGALALVTLVVLRELTDTELPENVPWDRAALVLGVLVFLLTLVKNLTDRDSAAASYVGVALAALVAAGAALSFAEARGER